MKDDTVSREAVLDALRFDVGAGRQNGKTLMARYTEEVNKRIKELPPAETENIEEFKKNLSKTINDGIVATNTKDVYSCGMRNGMRWCRELLDDKEPQYEHTPVQPEGGQDG